MALNVPGIAKKRMRNENKRIGSNDMVVIEISPTTKYHHFRTVQPKKSSEIAKWHSF